jgi:hypothetical protein
MEESKRRYFQKWIEKQPDPKWPALPLTHITKGITAQDIATESAVEPQLCPVFNIPLTYFFYGRAAYRVSGDGALKLEATFPFCFVFDPELMKQARKVYPFDTGAFEKRMYVHHLMEEMKIDDFAMLAKPDVANRLIKSVFAELNTYLAADRSRIRPADQISEPGDLHVRAYLELVGSMGRNEPDDRICTVEVILDKKIDLEKHLLALIVPHTLWNPKTKTDWLQSLAAGGATILTYESIPGRSPEYYQAQLEATLKNFYHSRGLI